MVCDLESWSLKTWVLLLHSRRSQLPSEEVWARPTWGEELHPESKARGGAQVASRYPEAVLGGP